MAYRPKNRSKTRFHFSKVPLKNPPVASGKTSQNPKERELTILFQFNGHTFEAYEVLGLAAGSRLEDVEAAYQQALDQNHESEHELFQLAFKAIRHKNA